MPHVFRYYRRRVGHVAVATLTLAVASSIVVAQQQQQDVETRLKGFDTYMEQVMKDWNAARPV